MKNVYVLTGVLAAATMYGCSGDNRELALTVSPGEQYLAQVIACMEHTRSMIDDMSPAADEAARRLADGGRIYVTDDETIFRTGEEQTKIVTGGGYDYPMHEDWGGFVAEACDRAGGLRHIQPVPIRGDLTDRDVVIAGTLELDPDAQCELLAKLRAEGALVILFGSRDSRAAGFADYLVDNGLEAGVVPVMDVGGEELIGPVAGIANVINLWTFTAELVAALTRQGSMPALWQSMFVPGAAPRNERIAGFQFHPDLRIMPIEKGILGRRYVQALKGYLQTIKENKGLA